MGCDIFFPLNHQNMYIGGSSGENISKVDDHIYNGPSPPLVDIVLFEISLPRLPSRFLKCV